MFTYEDMTNKLREKICQVEFTKKNGEHRIMECTLNFDEIPLEKYPLGKTPIKENRSVIRAFDVEKEEWRSFRVESVTNFFEKIF